MPELHARPISFALRIAGNMHFGSLHSVLAVISTDACSAHRLHIGSPANALPIARAKAVWCMLNCNRPMCKYRARAGGNQASTNCVSRGAESGGCPAGDPGDQVHCRCNYLHMLVSDFGREKAFIACRGTEIQPTGAAANSVKYAFSAV